MCYLLAGAAYDLLRGPSRTIDDTHLPLLSPRRLRQIGADPVYHEFDGADLDYIYVYLKLASMCDVTKIVTSMRTMVPVSVHIDELLLSCALAVQSNFQSSPFGPVEVLWHFAM